MLYRHQLMAEGTETLGFTDVEHVSDMTEDRRKTSDVSFYGKTERENVVTLQKGTLPSSFLGKSIGPTVRLKKESHPM